MNGAGPATWYTSPDLQTWEDNRSQDQVDFRATLVTPASYELVAASSDQCSFPLAIYMMGLGHKSDDIVYLASQFALVASEPFVLVVPARPKNAWWFIKGMSEYSWITGEFQQERVISFANWMAYLAGKDCVDSKRVGIFGFSAGAYAIVEILAQCSTPLSGVGLGGIHGHGQLDLADIPKVHHIGAAAKFGAFLHRLSQHQGVPWIEATHCVDDLESRWEDATRIFSALNERQRQLGLPEVCVRQLDAFSCDVVSGKAKPKHKTHHNYFGTAFLRREFFVALFGGPPPVPGPLLPYCPALRSSKPASQVSTANGRLPKPCTLEQNAEPMLEVSAGDVVLQPESLIFEWDAGAGKKRKWREYPLGPSKQVAQAFAKLSGKGQTHVEIEGYRYTLDFDSMQQVAQHSGHTRRIRLVKGS